MAAGPKGVAGRRDSLPTQQAAADPLQTYCPDLDQWPRSWAYEAGDIAPGLQIVECFKPFLREVLSRHLSRQTLRQHRDNVWALPTNAYAVARQQHACGARYSVQITNSFCRRARLIRGAKLEREAGAFCPAPAASAQADGQSPPYAPILTSWSAWRIVRHRFPAQREYAKASRNPP